MAKPLVLQRLDALEQNTGDEALNTHIIDDTKHTGYAVTTNLGNAYSVTIPNLTALTDGLEIRVKFNIASTGAITINPNNLGTKNVVDYFGNPVTNVRADLIANLAYSTTSGNFTLLGKGGGGNATPDQLLLNAKATVDSGPIVGTMPNNGTLNYTPSKLSQLIPTGYISGGTVNAVTFDATKVLEDTTIAGTQGTMPNLGSPTYTPTTIDQAINGYISNGKVKGDANLLPENIVNNKTIFNILGTATVASLGGRQYASGPISATKDIVASVSGLSFTPSIVQIYRSNELIFIEKNAPVLLNSTYYYGVKVYYDNGIYNSNVGETIYNTNYYYISSDGFNFLPYSSGTYTWKAWS